MYLLLFLCHFCGCCICIAYENNSYDLIHPNATETAMLLFPFTPFITRCYCVHDQVFVDRSVGRLLGFYDNRSTFFKLSKHIQIPLTNSYIFLQIYLYNFTIKTKTERLLLFIIHSTMIERQRVRVCMAMRF